MRYKTMVCAVLLAVSFSASGLWPDPGRFAWSDTTACGLPKGDNAWVVACGSKRWTRCRRSLEYYDHVQKVK